MKRKALGWLACMIAVLNMGPVAAVSQEAASRANADALLLLGPIESIDNRGIIRVLGYNLAASPSAGLQSGDAVAIFGRVRTDGQLAISKIVRLGAYIAGSSPILLTGKIERFEADIGRAVVGTVPVDLTPAYGSKNPTQHVVGEIVQIAGTQPAINGVVLAEGISGGAVKGISGGAVKGISGGAVKGISGGAVKGISGGAVKGISGGAVQ